MNDLSSLFFRWPSTAKAWCTQWFSFWPQSHLPWVDLQHQLPVFHHLWFTSYLSESPSLFTTTLFLDLYLDQCNRNWSCLSLSLLRSCVSIWTAGDWTAGWDSVSFCFTPSSSSAPSDSRGCRGHTFPTYTQSYKRRHKQVFSTFTAAIINQMYGQMNFHFISTTAAWKLHWLPLINKYFT